MKDPDKTRSERHRGSGPNASEARSMSPEPFPYDVVLNHSAKDKAVVRPRGCFIWHLEGNTA